MCVTPKTRHQTQHVCRDEDSGERVPDVSCPRTAQAAAQATECVDAGGTCTLERDGFYITSGVALVAGVALFVFFRRTLPRLEALPLDAWRCKGGTHVT